jgi:hypothetical protein
MNDIKCCRLIETLKTFNRGEFNDFKKIAISPYFSKGRNYLPYIKALKKYYPEFEGEIQKKDEAKKIIFKIAHPDKIYNGQFMKNIFTDLIHFAEQTLFQKVANNYNYQNLSFLAIEEAKRNLFSLANHNINFLEKKLEENGFDEFYFYCKGMNKIAYSILYNKTHGRNHETGRPFTDGIYFIYFSIITLALSIYNTSIRRALLNIEEDSQLNENFLSLIDLEKFEKMLSITNDQYKEFILIFVYYLIHKTKKTGFSNYVRMRNLLFRNYPKFNSRMLFYVTSIIQSTLFENKDNMKEKEFRKEFHKIALFSLNNNCYKIMKTGVFQFNKFRSYYLNALALGEIDWVRNFANKYIPELLPDLRNETLHIINSNIKFENKLYDESLKELKIKFSNTFSKIDQRMLKLKIFYSKGAVVHAEESLETFKKFINQNNMTKLVFRSNLTLFIRYYKKLLNSAEGKESEPEIILNELKKTPTFAERSWLINNFENVIII